MSFWTLSQRAIKFVNQGRCDKDPYCGMRSSHIAEYKELEVRKTEFES